MVPGVAGKKIKWTEEEDQMLRDLVEKHGTKKWSFISTLFENKGSKQCRRRWQNKLSMDAKNTSWTDEEDDILLKVKNSLCRRPVRTRRGPPPPRASSTRLTPTRQTPNYNAVPQEARKSLDGDRQAAHGPDGQRREEQVLCSEEEEAAG